MILCDSAPLLTITDSAAAKVKALVLAQGNPSLKLRVYIVGGGCSGFQYGFKLDSEINIDDTIVDIAPISLVVSELSIPYLQGAVVDYVENLQGAQFVVKNPNAESTCGCGSSFALKECRR